MDLSGVQIQTERLSLVPITMEYKVDVFREFQEPVTEFVYSKPPTEIGETEAFIQTAIDGLKNGSNLQLVILDKQTKEFLGCAGLHELGKPDPELGIWLKQSAQGHKYGLEVMKAIKDWADKNIEYEYLRYAAVEQNIPSRKIAESLGGKIVKECDLKNLVGRTHHLMEYWIERN